MFFKFAKILIFPKTKHNSATFFNSFFAKKANPKANFMLSTGYNL